MRYTITIQHFNILVRYTMFLGCMIRNYTTIFFQVRIRKKLVPYLAAILD